MANHQGFMGYVWLALVGMPQGTLARRDLPQGSALSDRLTAVEVPSGPSPARLSQQSCNTQCQELQTNCALGCDQDAACIRRCRAEAEDCTARCVRGPATPAPESPTSTPQGLLDSRDATVGIARWS